MIHQMDVVTAFLNGTLDEEIYMEQPPGYIKKGEEYLVGKLKKSIDGLKQSPRCWNKVFNEYMKSISYEQCAADPCVFVRTEGIEITIIAVHVDDLIIIAKNPETMKRTKIVWQSRFKMKDLRKFTTVCGSTMNGVNGCTKGHIFSHCWKGMSYQNQNHLLLQLILM